MATMTTLSATSAPQLHSSYSIAEEILETARRRSEHLNEAARAEFKFTDYLIAGAYANLHRLAADAMDVRIQTLGRKLDDIVNNRRPVEPMHAEPVARTRQHNIDVDWMEVLGDALLEDAKAIA